MADEPYRDAERVEADPLLERVRLSLWWVLVGIAPIWLMLTVTVAQIHPDLRPRPAPPEVVTDDEGRILAIREPPVDEDGLPVLVGPTLGMRFTIAGGLAAVGLAAVGLVVAPIAVGVGLARRRRDDAPPAGDLMPDSLVAGASWEVRVRHDAAREVVSLPGAGPAAAPEDARPLPEEAEVSSEPEAPPTPDPVAEGDEDRSPGTTQGPDTASDVPTDPGEDLDDLFGR